MKNNQKITEFLNQYSNELRKIGVYLLIIMFFFGLGLKMIADRRRIAPPENRQVDQDAIEVIIPEAEPGPEKTIEPILDKENKNEQIVLEKETKAALEDLEEDLLTPVETNVSLDTLQLLWPISGQIINNYGFNYSKTYADYRFNAGIDIAAPLGSEIKAALDGIVIQVENSSKKKITIEIEHFSNLSTFYSHLEESFVEPGEKVTVGQIIGKTASPGSEKAAEAPLLHFQVKNNGNWENPECLLSCN